MIVPAAMNIESAVDSFKTVPEWVAKDQLKELHSAIGADTAKRMGIQYPLTLEFAAGYQLGIQTARAIIAGSVEVLTKGADPQNIL